jgi:hypothetical protein
MQMEMAHRTEAGRDRANPLAESHGAGLLALPRADGSRISAAANEPPDLRKRPGLCGSVPCSTGAAVWPALARAASGICPQVESLFTPATGCLGCHSDRLSSLAAATAARIWAFALRYCFKMKMQGICLPEWGAGMRKCSFCLSLSNKTNQFG